MYIVKQLDKPYNLLLSDRYGPLLDLYLWQHTLRDAINLYLYRYLRDNHSHLNHNGLHLSNQRSTQSAANELFESN